MKRRVYAPVDHLRLVQHAGADFEYPNVVFGMRRLCNLRQVFNGGSFVESSRCHEPRLELLDGSRMYGRAVFLGFGCIECLVARLPKLAFGYTVTYSPELQKASRRIYLLWQT